MPTAEAHAARFLEDVPVGEVSVGAPIAITAEEIVAFGTAYDPQSFHTDPEAVVGPFGGLVASGWHVAALAMKQWVETRPYGTTPLVGMGVDELRWLRPVRAGDVLTVRREIVASTRSTSKPDRGVLRTAVAITNQDGATVMRFVTITQMPARAAG